MVPFAVLVVHVGLSIVDVLSDVEQKSMQIAGCNEHGYQG
jgi:hypothetical protein